MATIHSLVIDDDNGTSVEIFYSEAERDARCSAITSAAWDTNTWFDGEKPAQKPADWRQAYEDLEAGGWETRLILDFHEIDHTRLEP